MRSICQLSLPRLTVEFAISKFWITGSCALATLLKCYVCVIDNHAKYTQWTNM